MVYGLIYKVGSRRPDGFSPEEGGGVGTSKMIFTIYQVKKGHRKDLKREPEKS